MGYAVRFNKKAPRDSGSIEFVTTGILLRRLINDPSLSDISHVMIDEVSRTLLCTMVTDLGIGL